MINLAKVTLFLSLAFSATVYAQTPSAMAPMVPNGGGSSASIAPVVTIISTPGFTTVTPPAGAKSVEYTIIGAAAGAGSGAREAPGVIRTGGAGSSGGALSGPKHIPIASLGNGASFPVLVGAGGPGGAAVSSNSTVGNAGSVGDNTGIGAVWSLVLPNPLGAIQFNGIDSDNSGKFCLVGNAGNIYSSPDSLTWTSRTSGTTASLNGVVWAASLSKFIAVGNNGTILTSPDCVTWTARTSNIATAASSTASITTTVLTTTGSTTGAWAVGQTLAGAGVTTGTIINGSALTSPTACSPNCTGTGGAGTYSVSASQTVGSETITGLPALYSVMFDGTTLIAVGNNGTIDTSTDGITWTVNAFTSANTLSQSAWDGASLYIAVDSIGEIVSASSPTGTWTASASITPNTSYLLFGVATNGTGTWVTNGSNGLVYSCATSCGTAGNWTQHGNPLGRTQPLYASFANGFFFAAGYYSLDGITWLATGTGSLTPARVIYSTIDNMWHAAHVAAFSSRMAGPLPTFGALSLYGANPGPGGSTAASITGGALIDTSVGYLTTGAGGNASSTAAASAGGSGACGGGGAAGSADAANVNRAASRGGPGSNQTGGTQTFGDNGTPGALLPTTPTSQIGNLLSIGGSGGGGGAFNASTAGQTGANGASPCGGAGGGGPADNGFNSGAGGTGGNGEVRLIWYFSQILKPANDNQLVSVAVA